jgi:hypothetical protein
MDGWIDGYGRWRQPRRTTAPGQTANHPLIHQSVSWLALALLVARVGANHADNAFAANNFAIFAKFLN